MASSPAIKQALLKTKVAAAPTSEIFVDLRSTGSSFIDLSNPFHMLDELRLTMWMMRATVPAYLTRIVLRDAFSNAMSSCLNNERLLESITLFTDTATTAKMF